MRIGLIVTTYERPDALGAVLASIERQSLQPHEIIIADDGSGAATQSLIASFAAKARTPVRAVSQPHEGFRLTRLRNLGIAASDSDYLVFIDGDMVLHPDFIADHARIARRGWYTQGVRILADSGLTTRLIADPTLKPHWWGRGLGLLRRTYLLHSPSLSRILRTVANSFVAIKGCNQAFWRDDLIRANGFNEAIQGWGPEDKELCARLRHAGVSRQTLIGGGIAWHLHHPPASRAALPSSMGVLEETLRTGRQRCDLGLDAHLRV